MLWICHQVIPAGPPAGAGQSGSADQRKQEEWSPGEISTSQTSPTSIGYRSVLGCVLVFVLLLCDSRCFYPFCFLCRGLCMSWIR